MNWKILIPILVLLGGAAGYLVYEAGQTQVAEPEPRVQPPLPREPAPQPELAEPRVTTPEREPEREEAQDPEKEELVAPPEQIDNSDDRVREAAGDLSERLVHWLVPEQQLRKWVAAVDQMGDGRLSIQHRPLDYRVDRFLVIEEDGGERLRADGGNARRWDPLVSVITSIDPERVVRYYRYWLPVLEQAYGELGKEESFDSRVRRALQNVLRAPSVPKNAELIQPHVMYKYADPELENQSSLTKWLWRLGEENLFEVQDYARQLRDALDEG